MDEATEYRILRVLEDADEWYDIFAPRYDQPKPWHCGECGQTNHPEYIDCALCGKDREDVDDG